MYESKVLNEVYRRYAYCRTCNNNKSMQCGSCEKSASAYLESLSKADLIEYHAHKNTMLFMFTSKTAKVLHKRGY